MNLRYLHICCFIPLLAVFAFRVNAQTIVNSDITSNTVWNQAGSPYIITADMSVLPNVSLIIRHSTVVQFDSNTGMTVEGLLQIEGGDSVSSFVSISSSATNPTPGIWKGFRIEGKLRAAHFEARYANILFDFADPDGINTIAAGILARNDTAIRFDGNPDSLQVFRSKVQYNRVGIITDGHTRIGATLFEHNDWGIQGSGINLRGGHFVENGFGAVVSGSSFRRTEFVGNTQVGLAESNSAIIGSRFYDNEIAIGTRLGAHTTIVNNVIRENRLGIRVGPNLIGSNAAIVKENVICDSWWQNAENVTANTADLSDNCWCLADSASIAATIRDTFDSAALGELIIAPFDTNCLPDLVFPGDANHNQVANVWDILPIGLKFGSTGPPRPNASLQWIGQGATDWGDTLRNGRDIKHIDCNGDGIINGQDVPAIFINYGKRHNSLRTAASSGGYTLYFDLPSAPLNPGDTLEMGVYLGTVDTPAVDIYGAAFSIHYDTTYVKSGSVEVEGDSSWLGRNGQDMITAWYDSFPDGTVDLVFVRTDLLNRSGFGKLADISVVIDDDIAKTAFPFGITFGSIEAIDNQYQPIPIQGENGEIVIEVTTSLETESLRAIRVFPNPTQGALILRAEELIIESVSLLSINGQTLYGQNFLPGEKVKLDLATLSPGMYLLRIRTDQGILNRKVIVAR